jgi:DNA-binding response OmpR family regulator
LSIALWIFRISDDGIGRVIPLDINGAVSIIESGEAGAGGDSSASRARLRVPPAGSNRQGRNAFVKKVLFVQDLYALFWQEMTFLNREEIKVFVAATNDEAFAIHRGEPVDLILTKFDLPGMPTEQFCSQIRENVELRGVSLIVICPDNPESIKTASRCQANAVILEPVYPDLLMAKAQQLLFVAPRENLRVLLSAEVEGRTGNDSFYCRTRNVSISGMLIETDRALEAGTQLFCQFYLPNAKRIEVGCRIVRIIELTPGEDYQYGLVFTDISDSVRSLLEAYVRDAAAKASRPV